MKKGQKVYTTFYSRENVLGVITTGEIKTSTYSEDFNIVEEKSIEVTSEDGKTIFVDPNHLTAYDSEHELPNFVHLSLEEQIAFDKSEQEIIDKTESRSYAKITFSGVGVKDIKRGFTGSKLEIEAYIEEMKCLLKQKGYNSVGYSLSAV